MCLARMAVVNARKIPQALDRGTVFVEFIDESTNGVFVLKAKLKRAMTSLLPVAKDRIGNCTSCGACCELPNVCVFLKYDAEGKSSCSIYSFRPPSCRKYPRTSSEFITPEKCGYSFKSLETAKLNRPGLIDLVELET